MEIQINTFRGSDLVELIFLEWQLLATCTRARRNEPGHDFKNNSLKFINLIAIYGVLGKYTDFKMARLLVDKLKLNLSLNNKTYKF